jgi:regulatory Fis family protein
MTRARAPLDVAAAVMGPRDPRRIATSTLELVMALTRGRRGALFTCETETRLGLVISYGLDQRIVETLTRLWTEQREELLDEGGYYAAGPESFLVLACRENGVPVCLLYADTPEPGFRLPVDDLSTFSGILTRAFTDPLPASARSADVQAYLLHTSPEDIERDRLLLLLGTHDWNISRVARLLGTTRDTLYRRLRQYDVDRVKVARSGRARFTPAR